MRNTLGSIGVALGTLVFTITSVAQTVAIDTTFNSDDLGFGYGNGFDNYVLDLTVLSDGRILAVGDFTNYNGTPCRGIARLLPDGAFDSTFVMGTGFQGVTVNNLIVQPDGRLIALGVFSQYNGVTRHNIVRLMPDGQLDPTFVPGSNIPTQPECMALQADGKILVGGYFGFLGGIRRLTATGSVDQSFDIGAGADFYSAVEAIAVQADGKVLLGGSFTSFDGQPLRKITRLNSNGVIDTTFHIGSGFDERVYSLSILPDDRILVGGLFTQYDSLPCHALTRLLPDGQRDTTFVTDLVNTTGVDARVLDIVQLPDNQIGITGIMSECNGMPCADIIRLEADGGIASGYYLGNTVSGQPQCIAFQSPGNLIVGGSFLTHVPAGGGSIYFSLTIARVDAMGYYDHSFNIGTGANNLVEVIELQEDGKVLVAGNFSMMNGSLQYGFARLTPDGGLDTTFIVGTAAGDGINDLLVQPDGKVLAVGYFSSYQGVSMADAVRLNPDASVDTTFNPGSGGGNSFTGIETAVLQTDGKLVIGGNFSSFDGMQRRCVARLNADGSVDDTFDPGIGPGEADIFEKVLLQPDGRVLVGGHSFTTWNGLPRGRIARLLGDGSLDLSFDPGSGCDATVRDIALQPDGKVIIVGDFENFNGVPRAGIARLDPNGTLDTTFDPGAGFDGATVRVIIQPDGAVLVGGWFNTFDGVSRPHIARLLADGTLDPTFDPGTGFDPDGQTIWCMALQPDGKILACGWFTSFNGVGRNRIARLMIDEDISTSVAGRPSHEEAILVWPNPVTCETLNILIPGDNKDHCAGIARLFDPLGRTLWETRLVGSCGSMTTSLPSFLSNGAYLLEIREGNAVVSERLVLAR